MELILSSFMKTLFFSVKHFNYQVDDFFDESPLSSKEHEGIGVIVAFILSYYALSSIISNFRYFQLHRLYTNALYGFCTSPSFLSTTENHYQYALCFFFAKLDDKDEPEFVSSILSFLNGLQNLAVKVVCLQWLSNQLQQSRFFSVNLTHSCSC